MVDVAKKSAALSAEEGAELAHAVNKLEGWLAVRDLYEPTVEALENAIGLEQVDVVVLYGSSILAGVDVFVSALREEIAKTSLVSGGRNHAAEGIIATIEKEHPGLVDPNSSVADAVCAYMASRDDPMPKLVENTSSNTGAHVKNTMALLNSVEIVPDTMVVIQDPLFMRRLEATYAAQAPTVSVTSLPAYDVKVNFVEGVGLVFEQPTPHGLWSLDRYLHYMSGEVPRLRDDETGYGPKGRGFIDHVRIPPEIEEAHATLEGFLGSHRHADEAYA